LGGGEGGGYSKRVYVFNIRNNNSTSNVCRFKEKIMETKKQVIIKTFKARPDGWCSLGNMDYLMGKE